MDRDSEQVRETWNRLAQDWQQQVGDDGDSNRRLNSDPILWKFVGNVQELRVLDAGCGTGYLARKLAAQGAIVTAVDIAEQMIEIAAQSAKEANQTIDFRVEDCARLHSLEDAFFDGIISNYVLMDVPDLEATVCAFSRVLKPDGIAVLVFSHPCFPQGEAATIDEATLYTWKFPYFERHKYVEPPWKHFTSEFIWFHRPLSDYWKAFKNAGFAIVDLEEPRIVEEQFHLAETEGQLQNSKTRPYSIAFKLQKINSQ
jgi:ubiquinone/menaquinone biosynthesis C-methylase UbiE